MTLGIVLLYLGCVLAVGMLSHRLFRGTGEDYFLATRTIGPFVLLMSLFGTHMTAFSLLGASGEAYRRGIGVFGLMASSSAIVVPVVFFFVGTRLWAVGKRHGYQTQIGWVRDRWGSDATGLLLFVVVVLLLVPYLLIGVMGAGLALDQIAGDTLDALLGEGEWAWVGSLLVCIVVMTYVTFGGLRGTAWANTFQTLVFMILGGLAYAWIIGRMGGLAAALDRVQGAHPELLVRGDAIPPVKMLSYLAIPLSVGMFPHIFMHWLTAKRASSFRLPIVAYPACVAIVWLPSVLLGVTGRGEIPGLAGPQANSILVLLIDRHAPGVLAGLLAAGVFAAIMSSLDSQTLSLGTMFTQDVVRHYGLGERMSEARQILVGRLFVAGILAATFLISLVAPRSLFSLGIWSFSGYAALFPIVVAGLYWPRSTRQGVLASIVTVVTLWIVFFVRGFSVPNYTVGGSGVLPVIVMLAASIVALVAVSLSTPAPTPDRLAKFFPR